MFGICFFIVIDAEDLLRHGDADAQHITVKVKLADFSVCYVSFR